MERYRFIPEGVSPSQAGKAQVVEYLERCTHKVAISNNRIKQVEDNGTVTFDYKDYADQNKVKSMTLPQLPRGTLFRAL